MTKIELLRLIGDVLTELDVQIGSLLPSDPKHRQLQQLRFALDDRQRKLAGQLFSDNTPAFQTAADQIQRTNDELKQTIADINRIQQTIDTVTRLIGSVTNLATAVGAVV
ncbi:MAG TPA: hypothetical protein VGK48_27270 [Terriglobia bacterium]|jgi:hypothetical protein